MKKFLLLLCLTALLYNANSQTTYYWVGGNGPISFTSNSRWNTALNGSGTQRTLADSTDILIFDGTNVGGATPKTGAVNVTTSSTKCGQLKLVNNASLSISRPTGGGTGTITITGGVGEDFVVDAGSSFSLNSLVDSGAVVVLIQNPSTGLVAGNFGIANTSTSRIVVQAAGALVFTGSAICTLSATPAAAGYPFGSATQGFEKGVIFQSGSQLICSGKYSPMGGTSTFMAIDFKLGSNCYIRNSNAASTGSWTANKVYGNLYIQNGSTLTADGALLRIENFAIDAGCGYITHTSGQTPVTGNLVVNGTYSGPVAASTNTLVMGGSTAQSVTGSGTISTPAFVVGDNSNVTLAKNIVTTGTTTTNIVGKLDFGTNVISGTSPFTSRVNGTAVTVTGNTVAGSTIITNTTGTLSGNTALTITGAGIAANTNVIGFSSGNSTISMSQPATATATGVSFTFASGAATLTTAHPNGFDSLTGCVTTTGAKSFATGTNYVINAATTRPIGISSTVGTSMGVGSLTLNAPVTTNYNTRVAGVLALNTGKLTIRPSDTLRVLYTGNLAGSPFSSSKYIVTDVSGANSGAFRIDSFSLPKTFPIGTATDYLPVSITPSVGSVSFSASVFAGVTEDGMLGGTALTALQKANVVDAVWNIRRTAGTSDCDISLGWTNALEGSNFAAYSDAQIGAANYLTPNWMPAVTVASNATNIAVAGFTNFGAIAIGKLGDILPVKITNLAASVKDKNVQISFTTFNEINIEKYIIERSIDARNFVAVGSVMALNVANESNYKQTDATVAAGVYYYRIAVVNKNGKIEYSNAIKVAIDTKISLSVYPNPATNEVVVSGIVKGSTLQIVDAAGKIVAQKNVNNEAQTINVSQFARGLFILKVTQPNGTVNNLSFIKK